MLPVASNKSVQSKEYSFLRHYFLVLNNLGMGFTSLSNPLFSKSTGILAQLPPVNELFVVL